MTDRLLALLGLSAVLALAPVAANAQDGCAAELERLQQDVETAELSDEDRTKYESLMKGAVSLRDNGDDENCLLVVGSGAKSASIPRPTTAGRRSTPPIEPCRQGFALVRRSGVRPSGHAARRSPGNTPV